MGKSKKKKKPVPQRNAVMEALGAIDGGSRVSTRVNSVIEKMTRPPETIVEHLRRVGVDFSVVPHPDDGSPWLVCDFAQMTAKELQSIQEGGYFKNEYPTKKVAPAIGKNPAGADIAEVLRKAFDSRKGQETQSFPLYPTEKQLADIRSKLQGEPDTSKRLLMDPAINNVIERVTKFEYPLSDDESSDKYVVQKSTNPNVRYTEDQTAIDEIMATIDDDWPMGENPTGLYDNGGHRGI
jgi:hypothetical protein